MNPTDPIDQCPDGQTLPAEVRAAIERIARHCGWTAAQEAAALDAVARHPSAENWIELAGLVEDAADADNLDGAT